MRTKNFFLSTLLSILSYLTFNSPGKAAHVVVFAAAATVVHERAKDYSGAFLVPSTKISSVPQKDADSEELAKELWATTETLLTEIGAWSSGRI